MAKDVIIVFDVAASMSVKESEICLSYNLIMYGLIGLGVLEFSHHKKSLIQAPQVSLARRVKVKTPLA